MRGDFRVGRRRDARFHRRGMQNRPSEKAPLYTACTTGLSSELQPLIVGSGLVMIFWEVWHLLPGHTA